MALGGPQIGLDLTAQDLGGWPFWGELPSKSAANLPRSPLGSSEQRKLADEFAYLLAGTMKCEADMVDLGA